MRNFPPSRRSYSEIVPLVLYMGSPNLVVHQQEAG